MDEETMENPFGDKGFPLTTINSGVTQLVSDDVHSLTIQIVNVVFVGNENGWVLVDAGMPKSADSIRLEAERLFGSNTPPKCIVLTHGHYDHVGSIMDLVKEWNVPVYAHPSELPYLTGQADYPEANHEPTGLVSKLAPLFPNEGIDLGTNVCTLPDDGTVPGLSDWRWIHTPGHTPGHVSLFRDKDRVCIAGDAFLTVRQESFFKVLAQTPEVSTPAAYFTFDWKDVKESISKLAKLNPSVAITGHGVPMSGQALQRGLERLLQQFESGELPANRVH